MKSFFCMNYPNFVIIFCRILCFSQYNAVGSVSVLKMEGRVFESHFFVKTARMFYFYQNYKIDANSSFYT